MKQIVQFKKELPFKTKVSEITSISLEREIKTEEEVITGQFHITGEYKINEGSINRESFSFDLPFDITLDPRYDIKTVTSDIEDFYYDVVNEDTLKVNIDLYVEAEYLPTDIYKEEKEEEITELREDTTSFKEEENIEPIDIVDTIETEEENRENDINITSDLFSNLSTEETYATYYVYIVKEDDTLDKILTKYSITKEEFEDYNDITDIKPGDKVIIPKQGE